MKTVLIRDDDLNYFSRFEDIERVYGFMFEQGIPINFSTIPSVNASARTLSPDGTHEVFEPFLPENFSGEDRNYDITDNKALLGALREIDTNEYLLHGFEHHGVNGIREFESKDKALLRRKLTDGVDILFSAFGCVPETFVAPQDKYSLEALSVVRQLFKVFSLGWIDRRRIPLTWLPRYFYKKYNGKNYLREGDFLVTEHPGCQYSQYVNRDLSDFKLDQALALNDFTVIVTHHWEFYRDGVFDVEMWGAFRSRILALHHSKDFNIVTFSQLRRAC